MTTKQVGPEVDARRARKFRGFAAATLIGLAAITCTPSGSQRGENTTAPAVELTEAQDVATGFLNAYGAFDVERAISYLAADADFSGLIAAVGAADVTGTHGELRLLISYLEAGRYEQQLEPCEELSSSPSGIDLRCPFAFHLLGSHLFGRGPFGGSYFDLRVRDGRIVRASADWETSPFSPLMWEPYANWVSAAYPEDAELMYPDETHSGVRLTEESIALWERRTPEYVEGIGSAEDFPFRRVARIVDGVRFSFALRSYGWEPFLGISINKSTVGPQGAEAMVFWSSFPEGHRADPCADLLSPSIGRSAADLAAAVASVPGTELVAGPSDVVVGGVPAKHVVLTVRDEGVGCTPGFFYAWQDVKGGAFFWTTAGDTIRVWVVDVDAKLLFIGAVTTEGAGSGVEREIQQIVESIRFH